MVTNVLLSGVGGQGIITASKILSEAALMSGYAVKKSEIHGMSQRGGNVESHVRFSGDQPVYSPTIPDGKAGVLMAFELLEGLRGIPQTCADALVLVDSRRIVPMSVNVGLQQYPEDALEQLMASGRRVHVVPAFELARDLGEERAANVVMLGAASPHLGIAADVWPEAIKHSVRPKAVASSLRAFEAGLRALEVA